MESIEAIFSYVVDMLDISCPDYECVVVTPQKFSEKLHADFLDVLLADEKYQFRSAIILSQTLLSLYSYNSSVGVVVNLGERINVVPFCNGTFHAAVELFYI